MDAEKLQLQLDQLQARLAELEAQGDEGGDLAGEGGGGQGAGTEPGALEDEILLRLKVYRSLGIDLERDKDEEMGGLDGGGGFTKAIIRNDRQGNVNVVTMDKKFSRYFYANHIWSTL